MLFHHFHSRTGLIQEPRLVAERDLAVLRVNESILHLRPDYIKVADSLVRNLEADSIKREIITSLAGIGQRIGAALIAEGIERDEERQALVALGIPYGKGYLLGRPSFQVANRGKVDIPQ